MSDRFLRACRREPVDRTPIWLMRQAGRYMPEYRSLRERYDMLTICRTPELTVEVTLQPLRRFDFDAAILFSDIMIPLHGMGVNFEIRESIGPVVANPVRDATSAARLRVIEPDQDVPFVIESVRQLRQELQDRVPLIGFAGAPFTLASYIVEGHPSRELLHTKELMYCNPAAWRTLMDRLADSVTAYLMAQIRAGAHAVQLFDSWVGTLSPRDYAEFVFPYSKKIFSSIKATGAPAIHFGTGTSTLLELMKEAGGDVIGIDWRVPIDQAFNRLGGVAIQGNLDPAVMLTTPEIVEKQARAILSRADGRPGHIFNLGHGILPSTPLENVTRLIDTVHKGKND